MKDLWDRLLDWWHGIERLPPMSSFMPSEWFESRHEREMDCPDTQPLFNEDGSSHVAESMPSDLESKWGDLK